MSKDLFLTKIYVYKFCTFFSPVFILKFLNKIKRHFTSKKIIKITEPNRKQVVVTLLFL